MGDTNEQLKLKLATLERPIWKFYVEGCIYGKNWRGYAQRIYNHIMTWLAEVELHLEMETLEP